MKYIKRTVSVLLLLCLLLSMAGCKTTMPNLEADEQKIIKSYVSLIGKEKAEVCKALKITEDQLQYDEYTRDYIAPIHVELDNVSMQLCLGFYPDTGILGSVVLLKKFDAAKEDFTDTFPAIQALAQLNTQKYGESYNEWSNPKASESPTDSIELFLFEDHTAEDIRTLSAQKKDGTISNVWILTEKMPESVQDYTAIKNYLEPRSSGHSKYGIYEFLTRIQYFHDENLNPVSFRISYYPGIGTNKKPPHTYPATVSPAKNETELFEDYLSLIGKDRAAVLSALGISADQVRKSSDGFDVIPPFDDLPWTDAGSLWLLKTGWWFPYETHLKFNSKTGLLEQVDLVQKGNLETTNLQSLSNQVVTVAKHYVQKYGTPTKSKTLLFADMDENTLAYQIRKNGTNVQNTWVTTLNVPGKDAKFSVQMQTKTADGYLEWRVSYIAP